MQEFICNLEESHGLMDKVLEFSLKIIEFELQLVYYVHF